ncbi:cupin domain-containing protein [Anaerolineales bacterium HSG24]|nr:cupin domain-containing protein [Anaerolineales bacterium HSG24]
MSKFILSSETPRDTLDWGTLAWLSHPPATANKHLTVIDVLITPGQGHDFHRHPGQEEVIFVIEGKIEQWIEQEKTILGPGDAAYIDEGVVHASFNIGEGDAKLLAILGPCVGEIGYGIEEVADQSPWNNLRK